MATLQTAALQSRWTARYGVCVGHGIKSTLQQPEWGVHHPDGTTGPRIGVCGLLVIMGLCVSDDF